MTTTNTRAQPNPDMMALGCARPVQRPREPVLVLVHADGFLEVFAGKHVDVRVLNVPYIGTPEGEIEAERFIETTVPLRYRELYWPDLRRAMHMPRLVTPTSIAETRLNIELLKAIQNITPPDEVTTWTC